MNTRSSIQKIAGTLGGDPVTMLTCTVESVSIPDRTCTVTPVNGLFTSFPAFLMAEIDDGVLIVPSTGSTVKVIYSNRNAPTVVQYSQIDQVLVIAGDTKLSMQNGKVAISQDKIAVTLSGGKINIKNDSQDFKTVMDNLFQHLAAMTFTNGAGVTGAANNISDINTDKSNFDQIFN